MADTSTEMKPQLFSGARGIIYLSGVNGDQPLAFVTDISIQESDQLRPTYVIGSMNPKTIEPLSEDVRVSVGRIIPMIDSKGAKIANPTAIGLKLEPRIVDMLTTNTVTITIMDKNPADPASPVILASVKYCRFAGRSMSMGTGDIASERYEFMGIFDAGNGGASKSTTDEAGTAPINYGFES